MPRAQIDADITLIVTVGHRAPYASGYHHSALQLRHYIIIRGSLHSKYVLNFEGHSHDYERGKAEDDVVSATVRTGGSELEERPAACFGYSPGFRGLDSGSCTLVPFACTLLLRKFKFFRLWTGRRW